MTEKITNPFKYTEEPELSRIFDSLTSLRDRVNARFQEANKIAGISAGEGFKKIPEISVPLQPNYRNMRGDTWTRQPISKIDETVKEYIASVTRVLDEAEAAEKEIIEHNQEVKKQIIALMTKMGIPSSYTVYEYPSSRSRVKKSMTKTAGYMSDLANLTPSSTVNVHRSRLRDFEHEYNRWKAAELATEEKERIEKDEKYTAVVLDHPDFVADMLACQVNPLTVLKSALPGKKKETILYCVSLARQYATQNSEEKLLEKVKSWELYFSR